MTPAFAADSPIGINDLMGFWIQLFLTTIPDIADDVRWFSVRRSV